MTGWLISTIDSGSLLIAAPIAVLAGLVSFFSPCVIPLLPGYLSYVTGLAASELETARRGRMVAGAVLFVLGFSAVFVSLGALFGNLGFRLLEFERQISIGMGVIVIVLGLAFMGFVPWMQRDVRVHKVPAVGLAAAPLLGVLFGIGWTPCIGPTLGAVSVLALGEASASRGAFLAFVYCLGLGIPFVLAAVAFKRFMRASSWLRARQRLVMIVGGALLVVMGVLLVTGWWNDIVFEMRSWFPGFEAAI